MDVHERASGALCANLTADEKRRLNQAGVEVQADTFTDAVIRGLAVDWIVPLVVDRIIETIVGKPEASAYADGGGAQGVEQVRSTAESDGQ
jgi:hypothetical protein